MIWKQRQERREVIVITLNPEEARNPPLLHHMLIHHIHFLYQLVPLEDFHNTYLMFLLSAKHSLGAAMEGDVSSAQDWIINTSSCIVLFTKWHLKSTNRTGRVTAMPPHVCPLEAPEAKVRYMACARTSDPHPFFDMTSSRVTKTHPHDPSYFTHVVMITSH